MDLSDIKGVGPSVLQKLEKLGITSVEHLLFHFPFRYVDRSRRLKIFDLKFLEDDNYHCIGKISQLKKIRLKGRMEMTFATFTDDTGYIQATWFNNPYIISQYKDDDVVLFSGKIIKSKLSNPKVKKIKSEEDIELFGRIEPVYPETKGLKSNQLNQFIRDVLSKLYITNRQLVEETGNLKSKSENLKVKTGVKAIIKEGLPKTIIKKERLIEKLEALRRMHFPQKYEELDRARERLGFEEIYKILKLVQKRKKAIQGKPSYEIRINTTSHNMLLEKLSFSLTDSQHQAIEDIFHDLSSKSPMHRLLNGDVGSGKTIVAAAAAWQVVNNGLQVVILAPTSVLANQHSETFTKLLGETEVPMHLVTSNTRNEVEKLKEISRNSSDNENAIFIGTHALLHHLELFKNIGLVVIDEQHKFGVEQRELLMNLQASIGTNPPRSTSQIFPSLEGIHLNRLTYELDNNSTGKLANSLPNNIFKVPNVLSMSATPIPRSLALTLFGDIEVSFLEKPSGRNKIITKLINDEDLRTKMYEWIRKEIRETNAQVYIVCPLIEESEKLDAKAVVQEFETIKELYPEYKVELLHGRIKQKEKDEILQRFKQGDFHILVSTSVIEVGIDNPNATIMIVESAERFGLAQLHQIRGRVGRSDKQSYCFLKTSDGNPNSRLEFFASIEDGLKVAEFDLQQRGPGEVYGNAQSGIPDLKIANILDLVLIRRVKKYVK